MRNRKIVGGLERLWLERRPLAVSLIILVVGLPVVIGLAKLGDQAKGSPVVEKATQQAHEATESGDYADAYRKLKAAEGQATTKAQKAILYADLAAAAANAGKITEAINYLKLRHEVDPSTAKPDAELLGSFYERADNKSEALAQYKIALEYYKSLPSNEINSTHIESLKLVIAELEGSTR